MLTDALKKLGGRGRHERKVAEEKRDSKQKGAKNALAKKLIDFLYDTQT